MKRTLILVSEAVRQRALDAVRALPLGMVVTVGEVSRTASQNSMLWPLLEQFAAQLEWPVNGRLVRLSAEEWKDVLTAAFHSDRLRLASSLDGRGVVMLGLRTSRMGKREFSEFLEFILAAAAERGVDLRDEGTCSLERSRRAA